MLHNICMSAVAVSLGERTVARGPLVPYFCTRNVKHHKKSMNFQCLFVSAD